MRHVYTSYGSKNIQNKKSLEKGILTHAQIRKNHVVLPLNNNNSKTYVFKHTHRQTSISMYKCTQQRTKMLYNIFHIVVCKCWINIYIAKDLTKYPK